MLRTAAGFSVTNLLAMTSFRGKAFVELVNLPLVLPHSCQNGRLLCQALEPGQHGLCRLCTCYLINNIPLFYQHDHWYAPDPETRCQRFVFLGINLGYSCLTSQLFSYVSHDRCE